MKKIIKFGAPWCGPCAAMHPLFEKAKLDYPNIIFEELDIDQPENQCYINDFKIISIPTIMCFNDTKVVSKNTGGMSYDGLKQIIDNLIKSE